MVKPRILIVDDEPAITRVFQAFLQDTGRYEVLTENDPTKVLAVVEKFRPDLVVIDVIMPGLDGSGVVAQLKSQPALRDLPIIFVTAVVSKEHVTSRGRVIVGYPFLAKPVEANELVDCIDRELMRRAA
jgi:two-component system OmpR family response regulator